MGRDGDAVKSCHLAPLCAMPGDHNNKPQDLWRLIFAILQGQVVRRVGERTQYARAMVGFLASYRAVAEKKEGLR
jgi:hypothetical protein